MKFLVGILYCGEPQFEKCIESIQLQEEVESAYFVIENLPNKEAHDKLYETFMSRREEYDIFVKLDADMVIQRNDFFSYIKKTVEKNQALDWIHLWIYDYFFESYISGLNVFSNRVKWTTNSSNVYTDRTLNEDSVRDKMVISNPREKWVYHCPKPSMEQAFNFGFHRGIKAFQFGEDRSVRDITHGVVIKKLIFSYLRNRDVKKLVSIQSYLYAVKHEIPYTFANKNNKGREKIKRTIISSENSHLFRTLLLDFNFWLITIFGKYGYLLIFYKKKFFKKTGSFSI